MISYDFYLSYSYLLLHLIGLSLVQVYLETDMIAFFFICESYFKDVAVLCPLVNRKFSGPCLGYYKRCYSAHWVLFLSEVWFAVHSLLRVGQPTHLPAVVSLLKAPLYCSL